MDFYYEQEITNQDAPEDATVKKDEKTNEVFTKLESDLNDAYEKTANGIKNIMGDDEERIKLDIPLDQATSEKAQAVLAALDNNLAKAETIANTYWERVKKPSFWSSITDNISSKLDTVVQLTSETLALDDTVSNDNSEHKSGQTIAGNRTEAELKSLSTDKNIYIGGSKVLDPKIDIESKTEEISDILKENKDLENLMNDLVPHHVSYIDFWNIYLNKKDSILKREETRKEILKSSARNETDTEVGWDDEEKEDENAHKSETLKLKSAKRIESINENDSSTKEESPVIISKKDIDEDTDKTDDGSKKESEDAETEDDDWE